MTHTSKMQKPNEKIKSIRYLYFSRYLLVHFTVAVMMVFDLFWLLVDLNYKATWGMVLSLVLFILALVPEIELIHKLDDHDNQAPSTKRFLFEQIGANVLLGISLFTPICKKIYPFAADQGSKMAILALLLAGIICCGLALKRLNSIAKSRDRYLKIIDNYKNYQQ